jgi:L-lysine 4-chlorinase
MDTSSIEAAIAGFLETRFSDEAVERLADDFSRYGFVNFDSSARIMPDDLTREIGAETDRLVREHKERRDLLLKTTGNTPRHLSIVKSEDIEKSDLIRTVAHSPALLGFLSRVARERVVPEVSDDERYVITHQQFKSDTHGWHWGDYSFALIWCLVMPPIEHGGMLQCVPHTHWNKAKAQVNETLCSRPIDTHGLVSGDLYFLRTDTTLHRTVPLTEDCTRTILNMTWASEQDLQKELVGDDRWFQNPEVQAVTALAQA